MVNAVINSIIYTLFILVEGLFIFNAGRMLTARIHRRIGPRLLQSHIDVIKCFSRRSFSYNYVMDFGSWMGLGGLLSAAMFIPFSGYLPFDSSAPIILILYLMPVGYLGMALEVSASGNPLATIGIGRALTLMLGYEVPFAIIILNLIAKFQTTSLLALTEFQSGGFLHWNAITMPLAFIAGLIAFQAMLAKKPFDTMIAPQEIASGPMVELGGKFLGLAFLQHAAAIFLETSLMVLIFLGGASNPLFFFLKQLALYLFAAAISDLFGRYKIGQAVTFLWVTAGTLAFVQLIIIMI